MPSSNRKEEFPWPVIHQTSCTFKIWKFQPKENQKPEINNVSQMIISDEKTKQRKILIVVNYYCQQLKVTLVNLWPLGY